MQPVINCPGLYLKLQYDNLMLSYQVMADQNIQSGIQKHQYVVLSSQQQQQHQQQGENHQNLRRIT